MLFDPAAFAVDAKNRQSRNMAFAASSIGVAFTIFQLVKVNEDLKPGATSALGLLLMGIWCLYAIISAALVKLFKGKENYVTNVMVGIRMLSIFYIVEMIISTLVYLISGGYGKIFAITFIAVGTVLYLIYFPIVFCKLNGLQKMRAILFVIVCLPLAAGRSFVAGGIEYGNYNHMRPLIMMEPPLMAPL